MFVLYGRPLSRGQTVRGQFCEWWGKLLYAASFSILTGRTIIATEEFLAAIEDPVDQVGSAATPLSVRVRRSISATAGSVQRTHVSSRLASPASIARDLRTNPESDRPP